MPNKHVHIFQGVIELGGRRNNRMVFVFDTEMSENGHSGGAAAKEDRVTLFPNGVWLYKRIAITKWPSAIRGTQRFSWHSRNHSCRKTSAGLARAALPACQPTVNSATPSAIAPDSAKVHQPTSTR